MTPEEIEAERVKFEVMLKRKHPHSRLKRTGLIYRDSYITTVWDGWLARAEQAKLDDEAREVKA